MVHSDKEQKVNEFCQLGNLEDYRSVLVEIFQKIETAGCQISARTDGGPSMHEPGRDQGSCRIRISLLQKYNHPIDIIWTILHEFGHHLSGELKPSYRNNWNIRLEREKLAWDYAIKQLTEYPALNARIQDFKIYQEACLQSYYIAQYD